MKTRWVIAPVLSALAVCTLLFAIAGCSKGGDLDTSGLEKSFQAVEPALKASADKAITAVKSADYSGALAELKNLANNAKLTPEQQQAVRDVTAQVEKAVSDLAAKAKGDATKAADDLKKSLPK